MNIAPDISMPFRQQKTDVLFEFERLYLEQLLEATDGNVSEAARIGQFARETLHRLLRKHGLRGYGKRDV